MIFEIDVSGQDLLEKNYSICVADKNNFVRGFKFNEKLIKVIKSRYGEGRYRYKKSKQGIALLKIRIYCIIIYYIFKDIKLKDKEVLLEICRDFEGHEEDIKSNLRYFLEKRLGLKLEIRFIKLSKESNADKYATLMRLDSKNKFPNYTKINLGDIEKFLKK